LAVFTHIVCCSDFSDHADRAFAAALEQARLDGARLTLLHVVSPGTPILPGESVRDSQRLADEEIVKRLRTYMEERYLARAQGVETGIALRRGYPSEEIMAHLKGAKADLVVLGSQGLHGVGLVLLGSVAERVSRRSSCCCLVVR
jgi:nucleotide-binding universal stress UspA family protein